jgi:hypothetical protein
MANMFLSSLLLCVERQYQGFYSNFNLHAKKFNHLCSILQKIGEKVNIRIRVQIFMTQPVL